MCVREGKRKKKCECILYRYVFIYLFCDDRTRIGSLNLTFLLISQASGENIITHDIYFSNVRLYCTLLVLGVFLTTSTLFRVLC